MDEGGGLQRVPRPFPGHLVVGDPAQFLVDRGQQVPGGGLALLDPAQDLSHVFQAG